MEVVLTGETLISLLTLTLMEIVLGIDNIIFISIIAGKLPADQESNARNIGLGLALIFRVGLLLGITWIIQLTNPLFTVINFDASIKDIILFAGGLFLLAKSTTEIHDKLEGEEEDRKAGKVQSLFSVVTQIILLDMIFSIDSILTAIGLAQEVLIMIIAVIISIFIMMIFAGKISAFINKHPTVKILALSFLLLIGFMLILEALHFHVPKGYIYFAIFFSLFVEMLNLKMRKKQSTVKLRSLDYGRER